MKFSRRASIRSLQVLGLLALAACAPASEGEGDEGEEESESLGAASTRPTPSASTLALLESIRENRKSHVVEPAVSGILIHKCRTRGVSPRAYFDIYVTEEHLEHPKGLVVARVLGESFTLKAGLGLGGKYSFTTYTNDDAYFKVADIPFALSINDSEDYAYFTGAGPNQIDVVCTDAPEAWLLTP